MNERTRPFSWTWVGISFSIFLGAEVVIGLFAAKLIGLGIPDQIVRLRLQSMMALGSFLIGGWLVGRISPGQRLLEPAVAAAITVGSTFIFAVFTPNVFYQMTTSKLVLGGGIAFVVALIGASLGEGKGQSV